MGLLEIINEDMKNAMKDKDAFRLSVIRMAKGAIQLEKINKKEDLTDDEIITVIQKQIKLRKDAINEFTKANRLDLAESNEKEIVVLNKYMPVQLSEEEIEKIINEIFDMIKPTSVRDIGVIMKEASPRFKGKADMSLVNNIIKEKLSNL